jgi:FlaA1/EpsC-like NDP-sugar epimerase
MKAINGAALLWWKLANRPVNHYRLAWAAQMALVALSGVSAFLLRFEFSIPRAYLGPMANAVVVWLAVKTMLFYSYSLGRGSWRMVSVPDVVRLVSANALSSVISVPIIYLLGPEGFPRSVFVLDFVLSLMATAGIRLAARIGFEAVAGKQRHGRGGTKAVVYGAGVAGSMLVREAQQNPAWPYVLCGFVDDDETKRGTLVQGLPVLGSGAALSNIAARYDVELALIAVPGASGAAMVKILERCQAAGVQFKTVPTLIDRLSHNRATAVAAVRDVAVEDLLGREPVRLDEEQIRAKIEGQVVLVTGAAGSIGSELCRQIGRFEPWAIVGYDLSENGMFHLEREMRERFPNVRFVPELGSIQNEARLADVFGRHRPALVYHAAAFKHVPLMESHLVEAVENNVFGTLAVARAAAKFRASDFVMISSDKAVRPANVMGATKRMAELVIQSLQNGGPKYVSVRFGNVLGSNGSVVPLFKNQIARGGPVTVTHPEMRRYFMTIPEAVQLVLQASTLGLGGETFVLDMGQPVRIVDLARNLILLSGLRPEVDIRIEFAGVRPGEKLFEELSTSDEQTVATAHEKIRVLVGDPAPGDTAERLERLRRLCQGRDVRGLVLEMKDMVPEYNPSSALLRQVLEESVAAAMQGY